jgi:hypothetical protein
MIPQPPYQTTPLEGREHIPMACIVYVSTSYNDTPASLPNNSHGLYCVCVNIL